MFCDTSGEFRTCGQSGRSSLTLLMRDESLFFVLCHHTFTDVSLPGDPVIRKPLLPGAAGDHGPVSHLYPGGQAAENSLDSSDHRRTPKSECKSDECDLDGPGSDDRGTGVLV